MLETVELERSDDDKGFSRRSLTLRPDGTLQIEGHDLGAGPEHFWGEGFTEYEFVRSVAPAGVHRLRSILGLSDTDDLLAALAAGFSGPGGSRRLEQFLETNAIESEFWSHVGD